ncbi:MAG: hypothetical protein K0S32_2922 [Bacteroidetes bacterium]|jgi:hypothetical protein|nr:hypothetical protein [Bacteroidota bacterium]
MKVSLINSALLIVLLIFCALMFRLSLPYFSSRYDVDFLLTKQNIIHIKHWRYAFYVHVFLSIFAMIAGLTQFSNYLVRKKKKLHRIMGYVYVTDILLLAGPSGLIMGFYANGFLITKVSFVILALLWMLFTGIALLKAKQKDFISHKKWMIRSFALTLSAVTLRLMALALPYMIHLGAKEEYNLISWTSWIFNLLVAEIIIILRVKNRALLT